VVGAFGWRPFFLVLGLGAMVWLVPWFTWMPRRPAPSESAPAKGISILSILRQRSAWGTCLGQFSINYYLYFLLTWLPSYLKRGRGFSMNDVAKYGGLLFLMSAISATVSGKLADRWINAGATPTMARKGCLILAHLGIGLCLLLITVTHGPLFIAILALTGVFLGLGGCNCWAVTQTLAGPHAAGRWAGVQNLVGNMAGWVAPMLTGFLLDRTGQFYWPFFITAAIAWIGAACWGLVVGPIEPVDWAQVLLRPKILATPTADSPLP